MNEGAGTIGYDVKIDIASFRSEANKLDAEAEKTTKELGRKFDRNFLNKTQEGITNVSDAIGGLLRGLYTIGAAGSVGFGALITYSFNATRQVQGYVAGIQGLTNSTQEASDVIKSMVDYVQGKPFDRIEVLGAARNLLVFGASAEQTKKDIELLGRAVTVSGSSWESLSQIFGRVMSSGRLMNDDFNQIMYAGINVGNALTRNLGVSMNELRQRMAEGRVSFTDLRQAMEDALPADVVEKASNTIDNNMITLRSSFRNLGFAILGVDFGKLEQTGMPLVKSGGLLDSLTKLSSSLSSQMKDPAMQKSFADFGKSLADIATTALPPLIGGLKFVMSNIKPISIAIVGLTAAFIGLKVISGIITAISIATKVWTAAQWLLNAALVANPIGLIVVAIGALIAGIALLWMHSETFRTIVTSAFQAVWGAIKTGWEWTKENWPLLLGILAGPIGMAVFAIVKYWDTIKGAAASAFDFMKSLPSRILGSLGNLGGLLYKSGQDLIRGLLEGSGSLLSKMGQFFLDKVPHWIREPFKKALGISSPSKIFAAYGVNIGQGLVGGLEKSIGAIKGTMSEMSNVVATGLSPQLTTSYAPSSFSGTTLGAVAQVNAQERMERTHAIQGAPNREVTIVNHNNLTTGVTVDEVSRAQARELRRLS